MIWPDTRRRLPCSEKRVKMSKTQTDFSKGSVVLAIVRLAVPMTLAQFVTILYNIVDRMYIGRIPEHATEALTGLGICLPIITIVIAFANLIGMGGAPLFSIERGKGHEREAQYILGNSFVLLLLFSVLLTILGWVFRVPLLRLLGASATTLPFAESYIRIYLLGSVFVMMSLGMNSFINAEGYGKTGMYTVAIGAVLNIVLDPLFIFVLHRGVQGAAIATVLSQCAAAIWTLHFLTGKKAVVRLKRTCFSLDHKRVWKILGLGTSGFTMAVTNSAVQMVCNAQLQNYGGDTYVAVMTIINSVREVISLPVNGVVNSAQPVIGFNYGAKLYDRVKKAIRFIVGVLIAYTLLAWAAVSIFPKSFIRIFSEDPLLLEKGVPAMHIYFFGFFMMAFQFCGQTTFLALGKSKKAIFFSIFRKGIIVIPLILLLPHIAGLGENGVFLAEPVSNFIGGAACFLTMYLTEYHKL